MHILIIEKLTMDKLQLTKKRILQSRLSIVNLVTVHKNNGGTKILIFLRVFFSTGAGLCLAEKCLWPG